MILYEDLTDYLPDARIGDRITIEGRGNLNRMFPDNRYDTFKVVDIFRGQLTVRQYRSKTRELVEIDGVIGLIGKVEFEALKKDY